MSSGSVPPSQARRLGRQGVDERRRQRSGGEGSGGRGNRLLRLGWRLHRSIIHSFVGGSSVTAAGGSRLVLSVLHLQQPIQVVARTLADGNQRSVAVFPIVIVVGIGIVVILVGRLAVLPVVGEKVAAEGGRR